LAIIHLDEDITGAGSVCQCEHKDIIVEGLVLELITLERKKAESDKDSMSDTIIPHI